MEMKKKKNLRFGKFDFLTKLIAQHYSFYSDKGVVHSISNQVQEFIYNKECDLSFDNYVYQKKGESYRHIGGIYGDTRITLSQFKEKWSPFALRAIEDKVINCFWRIYKDAIKRGYIKSILSEPHIFKMVKFNGDEPCSDSEDFSSISLHICVSSLVKN
jgi:hypothetical protein